MTMESKVIIPTPRIKLHWPDRFCSYCLQELEEVPPKSEMYLCPSCRRITSGKTVYLDTKVIPLA